MTTKTKPIIATWIDIFLCVPVGLAALSVFWGGISYLPRIDPVEQPIWSVISIWISIHGLGFFLWPLYRFIYRTDTVMIPIKRLALHTIIVCGLLGISLLMIALYMPNRDLETQRADNIAEKQCTNGYFVRMKKDSNGKAVTPGICLTNDIITFTMRASCNRINGGIFSGDKPSNLRCDYTNGDRKTYMRTGTGDGKFDAEVMSHLYATPYMTFTIDQYKKNPSNGINWRLYGDRCYLQGGYVVPHPTDVFYVGVICSKPVDIVVK